MLLTGFGSVWAFRSGAVALFFYQLKEFEYGGLVMKQHAFSFLAFLLALGLVCGMVVWTTPAHADNLYASIRGTVVDPSGAVVPDAKLTATNIATGLSYSATSSKDGLFAFLQ